MKHYDVAIIGSGPSGASTAFHLAKNGISTVLIEKETLPRYKTCGGGFVYRGDLWSQVLGGFYLYAEFTNGNVWSLNPVTDEIQILTSLAKDGVGGKSGISSFATNSAGEIFALSSTIKESSTSCIR